MLRQCSLKIWDEVPMQHRHCFEAVSRTLQDICSNFGSLFGGIPVVLGGDFAQIGPVVKNGQRHHIVEASLAKSIEIWPNLKKLKLIENMRLSGSSPIDQSFSQWICSLSYDSLLNGKIFLPRYIAQYHSPTTFVDSTYPKETMQQILDPEFFQERTIIAPKNYLVDEINRYVLDQLPGNKISLFAVDRVVV
ncbi:hypothetical protein G6F47_013224 [Rhizopus delemar]|nr:hypothetical protein G6F49_012881 [Rhizopus delemar]KAG1577122.1 hypothetical protein G6F47_013224 [Rhizopus delemar]KAG1577140.1 hypothetical protein G6F48_012847 [Rhizopus delemar]KAG1624127.1 hypothetical protein G6F44_012838 [Rhizopus delemar]